ncbi:MAG: phosphoribosyl-AMP cyclohydrolase [Holophagales bacterium]|nr:phosphoribosyl-AMP cyclohydrolase [Holophagales bacterium]
MEGLSFDARGLVPVIVRNERTGDVLTLAWANEEALALTVETRFSHFWSRSRRELWKKGETSGNVQRVVRVSVDCDRDAVLYDVEPAGPACHTGAASCFSPVEAIPARVAAASGPPGGARPTPSASVLSSRSSPRGRRIPSRTRTRTASWPRESRSAHRRSAKRGSRRPWRPSRGTTRAWLRRSPT